MVLMILELTDKIIYVFVMGLQIGQLARFYLAVGISGWSSASIDREVFRVATGATCSQIV